ncbi:hypothetical protein DFJ74DRAFT_661759 [Hyaloraphidium curvatum]|nr:hypothetical protein DFJ74DRAFT_661759 [Hyaloraphidium curvatum]
MGLSGYVHGLQVFEAMQKDGVTDPRLLFLALYHDVGKVALLDGEDPANVVCTNDALFVDGRPASRETLASLAGRGLAAIETQFGHDDVAHLRLAPHLPPEVSYVLRYHSFSPLLNGDLDHVLTAEERAGQDLLLRFWAYDHRHKSAANAEPDVDLGEAEMVVRAFLPRRIAI